MFNAYCSNNEKVIYHLKYQIRKKLLQSIFFNFYTSILCSIVYQVSVFFLDSWNIVNNIIFGVFQANRKFAEKFITDFGNLIKTIFFRILHQNSKQKAAKHSSGLRKTSKGFLTRKNSKIWRNNEKPWKKNNEKNKVDLSPVWRTVRWLGLNFVANCNFYIT